MEIDLEEMAKSLPPEAREVLERAGYFERDRLEVGDPAPELRLAPLGGGPPVRIGGAADRPTVLIFGSYT
jgi:hypothetical protein